VRSETIWLVSPVYFDVEPYTRLRDNARAALSQSGAAVRFVAIDDSAGADPDARTLETLPDQRVITPPFSLGHQRGLVFGLRQLSADIEEEDIVITLDADGEDQPEDLPRLLAPLWETNASLRTVVVAARTRRRETLPFKVLYFFFKNFFRSLTGTVIQSGNYAAYRGWLTRNVLFHPHFDLAYSSSLLSLGLNIRRVPCERGRRYAGMSKMTYVKLIQHGLRMLMPFADRIATRGLVLFSSLCGLGVLGAVALLALKMTGRADWPGWALYAVCSGTLLCAIAAVCMVIVFALFVQAQGLSLSQLDAVSRDGELERTRAS
jgi:polyisoprenyl-phosphate glycosyltransferase